MLRCNMMRYEAFHCSKYVFLPKQNASDGHVKDKGPYCSNVFCKKTGNYKMCQQMNKYSQYARFLMH